MEKIYFCESNKCGWLSTRERKHEETEIPTCPVCGSQVVEIDWDSLFYPFDIGNVDYVHVYGES